MVILPLRQVGNLSWIAQALRLVSEKGICLDLARKFAMIPHPDGRFINSSLQDCRGHSMKARGSISTWLAFIIGGPVGVGVLYVIQAGLFPVHPLVKQYTEHPVEMAEVIMFCCALGALLGKFLTYLNERVVLWGRILPAWDGQVHPVTTARGLREHVEQQPSRVQNTYLGNRVLSILDFVDSRGAANELDDHIRTQADNDAMAMEGSYSLLRFITWAIPILGFLGTVLGITEAIHGVTPEVLEKDLSQVTGGLATAFDTTALALGLTMILMFFSFLVERLEQSILEGVDHFVDLHLAHRFERTGAESGQFVEALRQNTQVLLRATEQLVERQASVWARSLEKADRMWNETGKQQQEKLSTALTEALERTLASHTQHLIQIEEKLVARNQEMIDGIADRTQALYEGINGLASVLRETGRQHQITLADLSEKIAGQTEALTRLQEGEIQLLRLQEVLQQNLSTLAGAGSFEQAVQSMTAAIHLLTSRVTGTPTTTGPRLSHRAA
jgi:hypothetical protein